MSNHWYPDSCCVCKICKRRHCFVWTDGHYSLHICANGCDGIPDSVKMAPS